MAYLRDLWRFIANGYVAVHYVGEYCECCYYEEGAYTCVKPLDAYNYAEENISDFEEVLNHFSELKVHACFLDTNAVLEGFIDYTDPHPADWVVRPREKLDSILDDIAYCIEDTEEDDEGDDVYDVDDIPDTF